MLLFRSGLTLDSGDVIVQEWPKVWFYKAASQWLCDVLTTCSLEGLCWNLRFKISDALAMRTAVRLKKSLYSWIDLVIFFHHLRKKNMRVRNVFRKKIRNIELNPRLSEYYPDTLTTKPVGPLRRGAGDKLHCLSAQHYHHSVKILSHHKSWLQDKLTIVHVKHIIQILNRQNDIARLFMCTK